MNQYLRKFEDTSFDTVNVNTNDFDILSVNILFNLFHLNKEVPTRNVIRVSSISNFNVLFYRRLLSK